MKEKIGGFNWLKMMVLIFIVAKLWGQIDWSWWVVFIPFYVDFVLTTIVIAAQRILESIEQKEDELTERIKRAKGL